MADWTTFVEWVRATARRYYAVTVKVLNFQTADFVTQAAHAQEADILIGMHGADLTNMMFQRPGSVVVELNPLFFFENCYEEMAHYLGLHYLSWTCTSPRCAFGGGDGGLYGFHKLITSAMASGRRHKFHVR